MDKDTYHAFALDDVDGPAVEEAPWDDVRSAIYVHAREIYRLDVTHSSDTVVLTGSVTSEKVKAFLGALFERHVRFVRNELEVAAPFEPAGRRTPGKTVGNVAADIVTRHPSIIPNEAARPGDEFKFTVDLGTAAAAQTQGAPVVLSALPRGWTEILVTVEVFCDAIVFDDEKQRVGTVTVLQDGTSIPHVFSGRVRSDAPVGSTIKVMVTFEQDGRHVGSAARPVVIEQGSGAPQQEAALVPATSCGGLRLSKGLLPATLMIKIIESASGKWTWSLRADKDGTPYKAAKWREEIDLKQDTREFAARLLKTCPGLRPGRKHTSELRGIGEQIWTATPACFKDLYLEMRERHGARFPIQIVTDEPHVPWEMMFPDAHAGLAEADHLFMTHPVARWFCKVEGAMQAQFKRGMIASFVPDYNDGSMLPATLDEGRRLVADLSAVAQDATYEGFVGFIGDNMPADSVAVLHFAGHAAPTSEEGESAPEGLRMSNSWVSSSEIHGGVMLGVRDAPFVVLNACSAGTSVQTLGVVAGWPASLAERSFGGVLAPVWAVEDEHASSVVLHQLEGLLASGSLGETMRDARVCYRNASATPYAYLCYGDVMARMVDRQ